jgi:hypothetical protein
MTISLESELLNILGPCVNICCVKFVLSLSSVSFAMLVTAGHLLYCYRQCTVILQMGVDLVML